MKSVSYTHLDVYKRQIADRATTIIIGALMSLASTAACPTTIPPTIPRAVLAPLPLLFPASPSISNIIIISMHSVKDCLLYTSRCV